MVRFAPCPDYSPEACRRAVAAAAGSLEWVKPGMRIGVKLNLVHAAPPEAAATTHPALVRALVELLQARGATVVLGDSPGGLYTAAYLDRVYRSCGLTDTGAGLNHDCSIGQGTFPQGRVLRQFQYTAWLDGCDAIINFCKLKTHGMLAMTCAVKNLFGTIPGTMKPEYHFRFPQAGCWWICSCTGSHSSIWWTRWWPWRATAPRQGCPGLWAWCWERRIPSSWTRSARP